MTPTISCPDEFTAVVTVRVPVAPDAALLAFADTARLARWFWPERLAARCSGALVDGGELYVCSEVVPMGVTAPVTAVVPGERIDCDWRWDGSDDITTVRIEARPATSGTDVVVTHSANSGVIARNQHAQGWSDCLGRLEQHVALAS